MDKKFGCLFEPVILKNKTEIRNRIVMAPMTTYSGNSDGTVSEQELEYYRKRSAGLGMLITACIAVSRNGVAFPGQFTIFADNAVETLKKLSEVIKIDGTKAILQIQHGGRMSKPALVAGGQVVSASAVPSPRTPDVIPRELKEEEIEEIIEDFGRATKLAVEAGFDGVEIHGANTYLIQQFFSPHSNRRNDKWGGDIQKRMLFPLKVADKVIKTAKEYGKEGFIVGYRLSPEEIETPGIRMEDTLVLADKLGEKELDYLHISLQNATQKPAVSVGVDELMVKMIKEKINGRMPVIAVGGIHTACDATDVLEETKADFIALGRELIMDPEWVNKVKEGREKKIITEISHQSQQELVIPDNLFRAMEKTAGWFPFKD